MAGFNAQEGVLFYPLFIGLLASLASVDIQEGTTLGFVKGVVLPAYCVEITPLSVQLCVDFLTQRYDLANTDDDKERARRLTTMLGPSIVKSSRT